MLEILNCWFVFKTFHILIADGIHNLVEIFVQVNGVEKIFISEGVT